MTLRKKLLVILATFCGWCLFMVVLFDKVVMPGIVNFGKNVRVPDIVEFSSETAADTLKKLGFELVVDGEEYDQMVEQGAVISQNPAAFAITKKGRRIHVMISKGPEMVKMTDVTGISLRQARIFLREMGLEEGRVGRIFSTKYPRNVVLQQSIPADSLITLGTMIDLTVSIK